MSVWKFIPTPLRVFAFLRLCVFLLIAAFAATAQIVVDEDAMKARFDRGRLLVEIPVTSSASTTRAGMIRATLTDTKSKSYANVDNSVSLAPGNAKLNIAIPLGDRNDIEDLIWDRLEYKLTAGADTASGIVSLSRIMSGLFQLDAIAVEDIFPGMKLPVRIRATERLTGKPVAGVGVTALLHRDDNEDDDEPKSAKKKFGLKAKATTDADGYAELFFEIPPDAELRDDDLELELRGEKGGLTTDTFEDFDVVESRLRTFFLLDKPLYQPGQKVQFRALLMRETPSDSGFVVAPEKEIEFVVKDEDGLTIYRSKVKSSKFGIVSGEWTIPADAKLGTYSLNTDNDSYEDDASTSFKVSRYELPNFVVKTKSDKPFYLPENATAEVAVSAQYLFGKPVAAGKVRVVREESRSWNYEQQKWEVDEKEVYEGDADADGKYVAKIPLAEFHAKLADEKYDEFDDMNFTAYFTDATSNRTEQTRFDLRVSKRPIHVYLSVPGDHQDPRLPFAAFIRTVAADGTPCACSFTLRGRTDEPENLPFLPIAKGKADKDGNAIVEFKAPKEIVDGKGDLDLEVEASDGATGRGVVSKNISLGRDTADVLIRADKTLYAPGEPIGLKIYATVKNGDVFVDVTREDSTVARQRVKLVGGRADVVIPYDASFQGKLVVAALMGVGTDDDDAARSRTAVVYPWPRALKVSAKTVRGEYRPGDEATMNFNVGGRGTSEAALGVVVLDRAVEERAATDTKFGSPRAILGDFFAFAGTQWSDVEPSKVTPAMQRAARRALESRGEDSYKRFDTSYGRNLASEFRDFSEKQFDGVEKFLDDSFGKTLQYPKDASTLTAALAGMKLDFPSLRDPWGRPYRVRTRFERDREVLEVVSDGADKRQDAPESTRGDDYVAFADSFSWFALTGARISRAVDEYVGATGKFVRDRETLKSVLAARSIDLDALRDPWGTPLRVDFDVEGANLEIDFRSAGDDRVFAKESWFYGDPVVLNVRTPYFRADELRINAALQSYVVNSKSFPRTEAEFKAILKAADIDFDALRDPLGRPYYLTYNEFDRYADRVTIESVAQPDGGAPKDTYVITPVTQKLATFTIYSTGKDGVRDEKSSWNDWPIASLTGVITERAKDDAVPKRVVPKSALENGQSALYLLAKDANDAIVPNASVTVLRKSDGAEVAKSKTGDDGAAVIEKIAAGTFTVRVEATGFKVLVFNDVVVGASQIVSLTAKLSAGMVSETVTITDTTVTVDSSESKLMTTVSRTYTNNLPNGPEFSLALRAVAKPVSGGVISIDGFSGERFVENYWRRRDPKEKSMTPSDNQNDTPRVREYFPETLLWIPELVTDKNGKASIVFRLGDNITTWNVYAVASDANGRVGLAKSEFKTFQPFFVDLDAPKFLTVGDEIFLPSQVRNYTDAPKTVALSMDKANWFEFVGDSKLSVEVPAGETKNGVFGFRASKSVDGGRQRVTALAGADNDAVEKPVTVRPDGEEITATESFIVNGRESYDVLFPANAMAETRRAKLKIYPNMIGHVAEAIDGLLMRPYGCGEQTISSTYPNLMILKVGKKTAISDELKAKARRNLRRGYEKLLGFQRADGGFGYWNASSGADLALTAYAIRFLTDARSEIDVDQDVIANARDFLVKTQSADGGFVVKYSWEKETDVRRTQMTTAYVARILGNLKSAELASKESDAALAKSLAFLKIRNGVIYEPYTLALYGLAALDAGLKDEAASVAASLRANANREVDRVYWNLETNTPFYGWGTPGRVETTAIVTQFLQRFGNAEDKQLLGGATMFLLKNKDRYGVWHSTQTTINVLDAFLAAFGSTGDASVRVKFGNRELAPVAIKAGQVEPVTIELPVDAGKGTLVIDAGNANAQLMAQVVRTHYVAWKDSESASVNVNKSRAVTLDYNCDKLTPKISETVTCSVAAERVGFGGYGMLLAEIGIPPGAEVSRESLDSINGISRYELLPDRIVFYMWATAGGTKFDFTFKPRYAIKAKTPASVLYDYYNEEARATVAPLTFEVAK